MKTLKNILLIALALALASPASGQSAWPADQVRFDDATTLEAKVADGSVGDNAPHVSTTATATQTIASQLSKSGSLFWNSGNDGPASGLNADLLDGLSSSAFHPGSVPLRAFQYAGPAEVWVGRPWVMLDGTNQSALTKPYLQSTQVHHAGDTSGVTFNNTQNSTNIVLGCVACVDALYIFTASAWTPNAYSCDFTLFLNDTYAIGHKVQTSSGVGGATTNLVASLFVTGGTTQNIAPWSQSCTVPTSSQWHAHLKIERFD